MPLNRVVTMATPIFAGVSGWIVEWCAKNLPGAPALSKSELTACFVTGAGAAGAAALKWLHGWQKHEERTATRRAR